MSGNIEDKEDQEKNTSEKPRDSPKKKAKQTKEIQRGKKQKIETEFKGQMRDGNPEEGEKFSVCRCLWTGCENGYACP